MTRRWPYLVLVGGLLAAAGACGGAQDGSLAEAVARLPAEARATVYESENDLIIAENRRDDALRELERVEKEREAWSERWARGKRRVKDRGGDVDGARRVFEKWRQYLDSQVRAAKAAVATADADVELAKVRLDQARVLQLVRYGRAPESQLAARDRAVDAAAQRRREIERKELERRAKASEAFDRWKEAEDAYARSSGDFDTGVWLD